MTRVALPIRRLILFTAAALSFGVPGVRAAELSVGNVAMLAGDTANVDVSGTITDEIAFGVTILVEIVPRGGNVGTVTFTPAPPTDIFQAGDPWPGAGTFNGFDVDAPGFSLTLNAVVDDDGRFLCDTPVSFSGVLASFPVVASSTAVGVWDVLVSTSVGDSVWECASTTLIAGTVTVSTAECIIDTDCDDGIMCTDDTCPAGSCVSTANDLNCADDGIFCNGIEVCDPVLGCVSSGDPCQANEFCNEIGAVCDECQVDVDCNDGVGCTDDTCSAGACLFTAVDANCPNDGLFCNGLESCDPILDCVSSGTPCLPGEVCDEANDVCVGCVLDSECDDGNICTDDACTAGLCDNTNNTALCDDGLFCTAIDLCNTGICLGSADPCSPQLCDELNDTCIAANAALSVADLMVDQGGAAELVVSGAIAGDSTFGVTILVEILTRVGNSGRVTFTTSPPPDIVQRGDPWPGTGSFSVFDTDSPGFSGTINGSVDDDGSFLGASVSYVGPLTGFGITTSNDSAGVWDVLLSTSVGDSAWEGVTTLLTSGTVTVLPTANLAVSSLAMPPDSIVDIVVSGVIDGDSTSSVDILMEIVGRPGNVGTLEFTAPNDIIGLGNPWGVGGTFSAFDVGTPGFSTFLNGTIHGTFSPGPLIFSGDLSAFPVQAGVGADGVWDLMLITSSGDSTWDGVVTGLISGTVTVTAGACLTDFDCDDGNVCTDDVCTAGVCGSTDNTVLCDDANPCTENDVCATGVCAGGPTPDGNACDDANSCNIGETCLAGICQGGAPPDCVPFSDDCNVASCDSLGAEGNCDIVTTVPDGSACDDGDRCNIGETCQLGVCVGGGAVDCSPADDQCNTASCTPAGAEGNCDILFPRLDGTICDDANACNVGETCQLGVCSGGGPTDCSGAGDQCNIATCDSAGLEGNCTILNPVLDGTLCDDTDSCNLGESCQSGVCSGGGPVDCSGAGDQCNLASCDLLGLEGNCDVLSPTNGGGICDDFDNCTLNDTCTGGSCFGSLFDCSSLDDTCNLGTCDPGTGDCVRTSVNEGGTCDDGAPCTINDICTNGVCSGTLSNAPSVNLAWLPSSPSVQSGDVVRVDLVAVPGACIDFLVFSITIVLDWDPQLVELVGQTDTGPFPWATSGFPDDSGLDGLNAPFGGQVPENDGNALYQVFSNFADGAPVTQAGLVVTSFDFRALDGTLGTPIEIVPAVGSFSRSRVIGAGPLAGVDITGTLGTATVQIFECTFNGDCDDSNSCTDDVCGSGVCANSNNTLSCDDGLFCTAVDVCAGGSCAGSGAPCIGLDLCSELLDACVQCLDALDCDDANLCTDNVCNGLGACQFPNNSLSCNDGLFCTAVDTCTGGACVGVGDACPGQLCDEPADQCVECLVDANCDDGNVCTDDSCIGNVCQLVANTSPCNDNQFCTAIDLCSGGLCIGTGDPCLSPSLCSEPFDACVQCLDNSDCDDGNPCTTNVCNFGVCSSQNNTLPCDDGVFCTATDTCAGGACVGSGDPCPGELCNEAILECVECFTVVDCPNDGIACTPDACVSGACVYPEDDAFCDDGLFCNGPETCSDTLGCQAATSPCDDPALCDEATDSCGCQEPIVIGEGSRYLRVTPRPGDTEVALRVTGVDPEVACVSLYVQADGTLGPIPVFKRPGGVNGWQIAHVRGLEIVPSSTYLVVAECETGAGLGVSTAATGTTWLWGDVDNTGPPVDILDILLITDGIVGVFNQATFFAVDIWGALDPCIPQRAVDISDAFKAIEAFQGLPFPCELPCP